MAVLTSQVERDETFARRRAADGGARRRAARAHGARRARAAARRRSSATAPAASCTARERIDRLVDPGTAFLELNALAAWELYDGDAPAAGIVDRHRRRRGPPVRRRRQRRDGQGRLVLPAHREEAPPRAGGGARRTACPCIYLVDSGGAFLPLQAEVFPDRDHFGRIFFNQARMSAPGIPQIAAVMGSCTAGGAYVPAMCGRDDDRRGHGHDLHRRAAAREGGDRAGRDRRGARRRRRAHAPLGRRRPLRRLGRARARARARDRAPPRRPRARRRGTSPPPSRRRSTRPTSTGSSPRTSGTSSTRAR